MEIICDMCKMRGRQALPGMLTISIFIFIASTIAAAGATGATKDHVIGRMKVTLMPEYDAQSVLVIQEGKFADRTAFPSDVKFTLPMEVTKLTDACSLSPGGHHFCQIFEIKKAGKNKFVNIKLPFPDFFIDYQYAPFAVKKNSQREFTYSIDTSYPINTLEVHVQQPARSEKFKIEPASYETYSKDDFEYRKYTFKNVKAGEAKAISVSYFKTDTAPSVDLKFSSMKTPEVFEGSTGEILLVAGLAALGIIWVARRRMKKA